MYGEALASFKERLAQTIAWCGHHADPAAPRSCLRSPRLEPPIFCRDREESVEAVSLARLQELEADGEQPQVELGRLVTSDGRLLYYYPEAAKPDEARSELSGGYFDATGLPPWDTWVEYQPSGFDPRKYARHLITWVPSSFLEVVETVVRREDEEALSWADDDASLFSDVLRRHGLLAPEAPHPRSEEE